MSIFSSSSIATPSLDSGRGVFSFFGVFAICSLFGVTGCYAEVQAEPAVVTYSASASTQPVVVEQQEDVEYVESAPVVEIETYPSVVYLGQPVYWVDGRWYHHSARGWGYYRSEPQGLVTHRVEFERRYPGGFRASASVNAHVDVGARAEGRARMEHAAAPVRREVVVARPTVRASASVSADARGGARAKAKPKDRR